MITLLQFESFASYNCSRRELFPDGRQKQFSRKTSSQIEVGESCCIGLVLVAYIMANPNIGFPIDKTRNCASSIGLTVNRKIDKSKRQRYAK